MDGILLIDKPVGLTSHDVVNIIRKEFKTKKVGHAGTLDPFASGLLIILIGNATKLSQYLMSTQKTYQAQIQLGLYSDTYDITGRIIDKNNLIYNTNEIRDALNELVGTHNWKVPIYSAKKINGKKLYELARKEEYIDLPESEMTIFNIEIINYFYPYLDISIACSHGTYIRTFAVELAKKLGTIGLLSTLRRTKSGVFDVKNAYKLSDFNKELMPLKSITTNKIIINNKSINKLNNGNTLFYDDINFIEIKSNNSLYTVYSEERQLLAIYKKEDQHFKFVLKGG
ncbi:tRNA pseudouridine(55) synthase TruB [Caldicellulosiruptoraceae bacterium PP1]